MPEITTPAEQVPPPASPPPAVTPLPLPPPPPAIKTGAFAAVALPSASAQEFAPAAKVGAFGDAVMVSSTAPAREVARNSGFGDVVAGRPPGAVAKPPPEGPISEGVEILFKPRPVYTEEARRLKLEGEVLLEVRFTASSQIEVLRVIRGLGHGLDETAIQAARQIRFKPAQRGRHTVDSTGIVHVTFQLAY